ncbi:hypothetical protein L873DRAFT_1810562 [Choiromyces venosus 120613-1]|uniref:Uncharacterized protein n=1 Tax=Choiromyces venosus 120613-1 TaxID=1336337 RepID=A0A3N4ISA6_9PEZI|nr:hypothetical protein L873DRAFT_1824238 [Choiromyces venosus 120613-1]RPA97035.1 hypothetical protein L873DRAFT_1810562 [Choiromyces venosus 120613-1]
MTIIQLTKNHYALHRSFGYLIVGAGDFDRRIILDELLCTSETVHTIVQGRFLSMGRVVMAEMGRIWG